jgi:hypothetical protein
MLYLLTAIGLTTGRSSTVHICTQTIHRTKQSTQKIHGTTQLTNWVDCWPCPVFASNTLAFTTEEKSRINLRQGKKNLSQGSRHKFKRSI